MFWEFSSVADISHMVLALVFEKNKDFLSYRTKAAWPEAKTGQCTLQPLRPVGKYFAVRKLVPVKY
jgi:hypothetical protein